MGMLIFSGLAYVSEKDEEGTMFISMPQVDLIIGSLSLYPTDIDLRESAKVSEFSQFILGMNDSILFINDETILCP